ncbi:MAG: carbohydrate kinase family protein [Candidatus Brocadiia bacterium]
MYTILGLGEILWDCFEDERVLGGAPANFAYQVKQMGHTGIPLSRVGCDQLGEDVFSTLEEARLPTEFLQRDASHPTGRVLIEVDKAGVPDFAIVEDVAWDYLESDERWTRLARKSNAICFGTLAQRSAKSRQTIREVLLAASEGGGELLFDVNFRQDFYNREIVERSLELCTALKLNHEEIVRLGELLAINGGEQKVCDRVMIAYDVNLVCVTRGPEGCTLYADQDRVDAAVPPVEVVDTVGSGDAFSAGLMVKYLDGCSLSSIAHAANLLGSFVAGRRGAMPAVPESIVVEFEKL